MMTKLNCFFLITVISVAINYSCDSNLSKPNKPKLPEKEKKELKIEQISKSKDCIETMYKVPVELNLIDIKEINATILVDLKYGTNDNFMKKKLYHRINKAYLQKDVATRLSACQDFLNQIKPGFKLLIYDAVRPVSVQQKMWDALDSIPLKERVKFVSNPKNRSLHNFGAAVDLTICNEKGEILDMGAGYDDIRKIAYPKLESYFLNTGELKPFQVENRELLRKVMQKEGFRNIPTEWWHFNACSRKQAILKYQVLMNEP
jgi:D-alanyl-D-alanine dipeptidase